MARTKKINKPVDEPLPENVRVLKNGALYDDEKKRISSVEALNHAAGFISHELGMRMRIRVPPCALLTCLNKDR